MLLSDIDQMMTPLVGGKGANLGELTRAGFTVPPGFCVTTQAYEAFVRTSLPFPELLESLGEMAWHNTDSIREGSGRIRDPLEALLSRMPSRGRYLGRPGTIRSGRAVRHPIERDH